MQERLNRLIEAKIKELNRWADVYAEDKEFDYLSGSCQCTRGRIYQLISDIHDMHECRDGVEYDRR